MTTKHEKEYRQLGLTVAYYRKMQNLSQMNLAERANLSRTHISNIEAPNMHTSVSLEALFDIADALGIPVKALFDFRE